MIRRDRTLSKLHAGTPLSLGDLFRNEDLFTTLNNQEERSRLKVSLKGTVRED